MINFIIAILILILLYFLLGVVLKVGRVAIIVIIIVLIIGFFVVNMQDLSSSKPFAGKNANGGTPDKIFDSNAGSEDTLSLNNGSNISATT